MLLVRCLEAWRCDCARFKVGITAALMAAFLFFCGFCNSDGTLAI